LAHTFKSKVNVHPISGLKNLLDVTASGLSFQLTFYLHIPGRELETSSDSDEASSSPENGKFSLSVLMYVKTVIVCGASLWEHYCILGDVVQRLYQSILFFQGVIQFHGA
jgi:hypothetical protein